MRTLNPAIKFLALLFVTFILAFRYNPLLNLSVFAICMLLLFLSKVRAKTLGLLMLPILLASVGMFFTGYRFSATVEMPVSAADFLISDSRVFNGIAQASRVLAYAGVGFLFTLTTDRIEMVKSFEKQFRLPQIWAYGLLAAWGIFPQVTQEYRRTRAAFRARGLKVLPVSPALLKPLLIKSIRWSEELSIAMESKGFSGDEKRTAYQEPKVRLRDLTFLFFSVGMTALASNFLR